MVANLVHARTEYGTFDFHHIRITGNDGIDADRVVVGHTERGHIKLVDVIDRILCSWFSNHADWLAIGISGKTSGIVYQGAHALRLLHLVVHGALYLTCNFHQAVVGTHHDDVVVAQAHVATQLAVEDVVIDINGTYEFVVAIDLDITQRTNLAGTASHVQGMEYGREGWQRIGAGCLELTHHVNDDTTCLTYRKSNLRRTVAGT